MYDLKPPDRIDTLFLDSRIAAMNDGTINILYNFALAVTDKKISWMGLQEQLSSTHFSKTVNIIYCKNKWLLPGFVDCHTHLVWAGSRSDEFEKRLKGISYEKIAEEGGGIMSTVNETRNATREQLFNLSAKRVAHFLKQGVTTLEIKSGYGLDLETELKILKTISMLDNHFPLHIEATFLGAHTVPSEYKKWSDEYVSLVIDSMLPQIKKQGIATAVDVFCEKIAFSRAQTEKVFEKAAQLGFKIKLHAEQLSDSDGSALAADFDALSCDHLEYLSESGAQKMAENNVAAVLLPGAFYYLNQKKKPPVDLLRQLKIPMAVSTDLNPGSSPIHSITQAMNMACILFGLTCEEALLGTTVNGAKALGLENKKGSLSPGKDADIVVWDIDTPIDLCYISGIDSANFVMAGGNIIHNSI